MVFILHINFVRRGAIYYLHGSKTRDAFKISSRIHNCSNVDVVIFIKVFTPTYLALKKKNWRDAIRKNKNINHQNIGISRAVVNSEWYSVTLDFSCSINSCQVFEQSKYSQNSTDIHGSTGPRVLIVHYKSTLRGLDDRGHVLDYINLLKEQELCINTKKTKQIKQTKPQIFQKLNKTPQTNKPKKAKNKNKTFF